MRGTYPATVGRSGDRVIHRRELPPRFARRLSGHLRGRI